MTLVEELKKKYAEANEKFVSERKPKKLPFQPTKKVDLITCMDGRVDPIRAFGIQEGEAHIIRNGGGSAQNALSELIASQQCMGTEVVVVMHHTDCGYVNLNEEKASSAIKKAFGKMPENVKFGPFIAPNELEKSVRDDIEFLKSCPYIPDTVQMLGYVYDTETGKATQVV